ncbi:MAG: UbiA family prenyltransferase [Bacteroidales bacterium]|nr:UbiA family prenyltransferase [Bacteroidales bacterium]
MSFLKKVKDVLSLIKFSHTIFAMPFALIGFSLGSVTSNHFTFYKLLLIVLCMISARTAAMAFNRYIDREIDKKNIRTQNREIPSGKISSKLALLLVIFTSLLFIALTYFINQLCFYLSPVALLVILGYSYTKRFTPLCHFILGIGLSLSPIGAYIAVTDSFALLPILISLIVLFWTGGFDIIYSLQDAEYDASQNLYSIPSLLGIKKALIISRLAHFFTSMIVVIVGFYSVFSFVYWIGASIFILLLIYQHRLVKPSDLSKINIAFGTTNGWASIIYGVFTIISLLLPILL